LGAQAPGEVTTFVTVTHPAEFDLLRLQARSMARFLDPRTVRGVLVVLNASSAAARRRLEVLLPAYGPLTDRVRVVAREEVARVRGSTGWRGQQVLKLLTCALVETDHYVLLDSKNHFVAEPSRDHFVGPDGRARLRTASYVAHPLRCNVERVLRYVGLDPADHLAEFSSTVTPFVVNTALVRELVKDVERCSGRPFDREFLAADLTEFPLYTAWLLARGIGWEDAHRLDGARSPAVWPRGRTLQGVRHEIAEVERLDAPVFAVHRRALAGLPDPAVDELAGFWTERGLFDSADAARNWIRDTSRRARRDLRREKVLGAPVAAVGRWRRHRNPSPVLGSGGRQAPTRQSMPARPG